VAGLNELPDVCVHESDLHGDVHAVGQHSVEVCPPSFDEAEDVVPPSTVETARVLSQLEQDLFHLEGSGKGLDQDSSTDGSLRNADVALGEGKDVVPEASLLVVFHLGEIEIWTGPPLDELTRVVEEIEGKVEDGTGNGCVVDIHPRLIKVPPTRAEKEHPEHTLDVRML
jgi:hypothetical protein